MHEHTTCKLTLHRSRPAAADCEGPSAWAEPIRQDHEQRYGSSRGMAQSDSHAARVGQGSDRARPPDSAPDPRRMRRSLVGAALRGCPPPRIPYGGGEMRSVRVQRVKSSAATQGCPYQRIDVRGGKPRRRRVR